MAKNYKLLFPDIKSKVGKGMQLIEDLRNKLRKEDSSSKPIVRKRGLRARSKSGRKEVEKEKEKEKGKEKEKEKKKE